MSAKISKQGQRELLEVLRERYQRAAKQDKGKILDEFVAITGCYRKHAIRLLAGNAPLTAGTPVAARRTYDEAVRQALIVLWEAADRICGKRLKAVLPGLLAAWSGTATSTSTPLFASASSQPAPLPSTDCWPRSATALPAARSGGPRPQRARRARSALSRTTVMPLPATWRSTSSPTAAPPCRGVFLWSLVATDICTGWTEAVALVAREQSLVVEGLEVRRRQFPVPIKGIDSDNDSAFINETLQAYCQQQKWAFTRSQPSHKNDHQVRHVEILLLLPLEHVEILLHRPPGTTR